MLINHLQPWDDAPSTVTFCWGEISSPQTLDGWEGSIHGWAIYDLKVRRSIYHTLSVWVQYFGHTNDKHDRSAHV